MLRAGVAGGYHSTLGAEQGGRNRSGERAGGGRSEEEGEWWRSMVAARFWEGGGTKASEGWRWRLGREEET